MRRYRLYIALRLIAAAWLGCAFTANALPRSTDGEDLGLLIVGAITNNDERSNVALVKNTKTGKVTAVKAGHKLLEGKYTVSEVTAKYIVINQAGHELLVYQSKFAGEFARFDRSSPTAATQPVVVINEGIERNGNKIRVSTQLRDKLINEDLSKVLMQATAIPKIENGQLIGFRILQIDKGSIYDKAGLKDNDVITSINGINLTSVAGAVTLLRSLKSAAQVQIEFRRNGVQESLELSVAH